MTELWAKLSKESDWMRLPPTGFSDEKKLQDLVEQVPETLPLSGAPTLCILGREVSLGGGSADLVGVEPNGQITVIEVKLHKNPEAKRAVVAQILAYAAALRDLSPADLEQLLSNHLAKGGYSSILDVVRQTSPDLLDETEFTEGLRASLEGGVFRLVLVLDDVPPQLVRLVGFLESVTTGLTLDLVVVAQCEVDGVPVIVPQLIEPGKTPKPATPGGSASIARSPITDGAGAIREAIEDADPTFRPMLTRLVDWAEELEQEGLAVLSTKHSKNGNKVLRVRTRGRGAGLVTVSNVEAAPLYLWRTALEKVAPESLVRLESILGTEITPNFIARDFSDDLRNALTAAYREARVR